MTAIRIGGYGFNSIPGLKVWIDSQRRVNLDQDGNVASIVDLSPNNYLYSQLNSDRIQIYEDVLDCTYYTGRTAVNMDATKEPQSSFRFLHDGSPYLSYYIFRTQLAPGDGAINAPGSNANAVNGAIMTLFTDTSVQNRVTILVRAYSDSSIIMNAGPTQVNSAKISSGAPYLISHKAYGRGAGYGLSEMNVYFDHTRIGGANWSAGSVNDPQRRFQIQLRNQFQSETFKCGVRAMLLYDMTGKTGMQIDDYDNQIKNLILATYGV